TESRAGVDFRTYAQPTEAPKSEAGRVIRFAAAYCPQSMSRALPSDGLQAFTQVLFEMLELTPRTLASPMTICMAPLCPPWVTYQLHDWALGPTWNGWLLYVVC